MKKRIAKASDNESLLPMTEADVAAAAGKKSRPRPPRHGRKGRSWASWWCCSLEVLVPLLVVFGICLVVLFYYSKTDTVEKVASRLSPLKKILQDRKNKRSQHGKKSRTLEEGTEQVKERITKMHDGAKMHKIATDAYHHELVKQQQEGLPLYKFESLRFALQQSELVLLYFAASWCPICAPVTQQLDSLFRDILIPPPPNPTTTNHEKKMEAERLLQHLLQQHRQGVSLVHISSDYSRQDMENYQKENWMVVPYDSPDRNNLKRHFKTCAGVEVKTLELESRDHEIPTLIVIAGISHEVLSYDGVQDVKDRGQQAVDYWFELLRKNT